MHDAYISARTPGLRPLPSRLLTDERLARMAAGGDGGAFSEIYRRYQDRLYRYCRSIVLDAEDAADAFQATMTSAFHALQGERREITLKPWLYRIAHNEAISVLRRRRPNADLADVADVAVADAAADAAKRERLRQLVDDLGQLAARHRATLVMRELSGLSYAEIAEAFGFSQAAARQTVYEARRGLHEIAEGRAMDCELIRKQISETDGRLRGALKLRAHLKACAACHDFHAAIGTRRSDLALMAPPVAPALAASMLNSILGGGAAGGKGGGLAAVVGGAGKVVAGSGALKAVAAGAVTVAVGAAGAGAITDRVDDRPAESAAPAKHAATGAGTTGGKRATTDSRESARDGRRAARETRGAGNEGGRGDHVTSTRDAASSPADRGPAERPDGLPQAPPPPTPQTGPREVVPTRPQPPSEPQQQAPTDAPVPEVPDVPDVPEAPTAPVDAPRAPAR